jgi:hypothetical protein
MEPKLSENEKERFLALGQGEFIFICPSNEPKSMRKAREEAPRRSERSAVDFYVSAQNRLRLNVSRLYMSSSVSCAAISKIFIGRSQCGSTCSRTHDIQTKIQTTTSLLTDVSRPINRRHHQDRERTTPTPKASITSLPVRGCY